MRATTQPGAALLDVNVLVALAWTNHVHHEAATSWFRTRGAEGWATSPFTQAGFVRVSSNRSAMPTSTTPQTALALLHRMTSADDHHFWVDDITGVLRPDDVARATSHRDVTDLHLVAVAARHAGRLATFDTRIERLLGESDSHLVLTLEA